MERLKRLLSDSDGTASPLATPPASNQLEISLFGPGYGESVLAHLGSNEWLLIDSCVTPDGSVAPLRYLQEIGVSPDPNLRTIVASHWHDDHVRGLSQALSAAPKAAFVCSEALSPSEFVTLIHYYADQGMMASSGVREFADVFKVLEDTDRKPTWAAADRRLVFRKASDIASEASVWSLSPSDSSLTEAFERWGKLLPEGQSLKRVRAHQPNRAAVALWLQLGHRVALLGADLEEEGHADSGWSAIIASTVRPQEQASLFKVSHHGSKNGDHPAIWSDLLIPNPTAVLTPFNRGNISLPKSADVERILSMAGTAYITSESRTRKTRESGLVGKALREATRYVRDVQPKMGHIRVRGDARDPNGHWLIECFEGAMPLNRLSA